MVQAFPKNPTCFSRWSMSINNMKKKKKEYLKLTSKELEDLEYTGYWESDKERFSYAWKRNQTIYDLEGWDKIEEEEEYGDF